MRISARLRAEMLALVCAALPEEACGLVGGRGDEALEVVGVENELHSPRRFRMRPSAQLEALLYFDAQGIELAAIFHSHPSSQAVPSPTDLAEFYYPGVLTLIWSPLPGGWHLRGFKIAAGQAEEILLER